ncbi:multidrug MFS transporter [Clostridium sp. cel8]|jgi:UDP-N-acetylglucosamine transferase subunit ALG13|uniref:glycosyltransferase n=1 Tax=Clostridium sp. cel8 TaxID=2663123 RepID=UPI0015F60DED|nr:glycosyltransferase [Clostridium sp. cel8]MBA5850032.1 multidrug MFS transporter [Clostridium sp. cel8]
MIFVTVGTHEQPFNRLLEYVDKMKEKNIIKDDIIMQIGYSTYCPKFCSWKKLIPYDEMWDNIKKARIIITHGGPASFIMPLQIGKIPIVIPRQHKFGEHVNDHQVEFAKVVAEKYKNIIVANDVSELKNIIQNYNRIVSHISENIWSNNEEFNEKLEDIVMKIL